MTQINIFVSYSHRDSIWLKENDDETETDFGLIQFLEKNLKKNNVQFWYDYDLKKRPFVEYKEKIKKEIDRAHLAILLISHDFASSEFIIDYEMAWIKQRVEKRELAILPILVSPLDWEGEKDLMWIREWQILPGKPTPLINYVKDVAEWKRVQVDILSAIRLQVKKMRKAQEHEGQPFKPEKLAAAIEPAEPPIRRLRFKPKLLLSLSIIISLFIVVGFFFIMSENKSLIDRGPKIEALKQNEEMTVKDIKKKTDISKISDETEPPQKSEGDVYEKDKKKDAAQSEPSMTITILTDENKKVKLRDVKLGVKALKAGVGVKGFESHDVFIKRIFIENGVRKSIDIKDCNEISFKVNRHDEIIVTINRTNRPSLEAKLVPPKIDELPASKGWVAYAGIGEYFISGIDKYNDEVKLSLRNINKFSLQ